MKKTMGVIGLIGVCGAAAPVYAQDSVGTGTGLAGGDALPVDVAGAPYQRAQYVLDLTAFRSSWGNRFGMAPLSKASTVTGGYRAQNDNTREFFNGQLSAQYISQNVRLDVPSASSQYSLWTTAGQGVHPTRNTPGQLIGGPAGSFQFGFGSADFGFDGSTPQRSMNSIIGGVVNVDPANPGRLYVTRVVAAHNAPAGQPARSGLGFGAVDASGNVVFRADNNDSPAGTPDRIVGNNIFRVQTVAYGAFAGRAPAVLNVISNLGGSDASATNWVVANSSTTHTTPTLVPAGVGDLARGSAIGLTFGPAYFFESALNSVTTNATYRGAAADSRGGVSFTPVQIFPGSTGTAAAITKNATGGGTPAENLSIWGTTGVGGVLSQFTIAGPRNPGQLINDPCSPGFGGWLFDNGEFRHYSGAVAFRGGNGQIAVAKDQAGRGLVAATAVSGLLNTNDSPYNAIMVYRFDTNNPSAGQWVAAAWYDFINLQGKAILGDSGNDGTPFTGDAGENDGVLDLNPSSATYDAPIGRLAAFAEFTGAGNRLGPTMTAPAFDSVGNIYFISGVKLNKAGGFIDDDTALIRAVYDPANFCYRLELLVELGDTKLGQNSGVRYNIPFMSSSLSTGASSSGFWSGNVASYAFGGTDASQFTTSDPRTLGGLVFNAGIVYDVDGDGDYENPTSTGGNPASADQAYNALMYIGNIEPLEEPGCPADFDGDGFVDFFDFDAYVACFEDANACPPGKTADFDGDGFIDFFDFDAYVAAFEAGC